MADSPEAAQPIEQDDINKTFEPPKGLEGVDELINPENSGNDPEITIETIDEEVQKTKEKIDEVISEEEEKNIKNAAKAAIGNDPENLLGIVQNLRAARLNQRIDLITSALKELVIEGGESAQAAQQAVEQIERDNATYTVLERILPEGQFNEAELFNQLYLLTEVEKGHETIGRVFAQLEQAGQQAAMEKMINILMVMKMQAGVHAENALLALDQISVYGAKNPTIKEVADQAANMSPDKAESLKVKIEETAMFSAEPTSPDNVVVATPETEAEKLARREAFNQASKALENELDEDLAKAQAETDRIVESNIFPTDWSSNQIFRAKEAYKQRQDLKLAEKERAEKEANAKRAAERAKLTNDDAALYNFLGIKPTETAKTKDKVAEKAKANPVPISAETKVATVVDKTPPKPEKPISQPAKNSNKPKEGTLESEKPIAVAPQTPKPAPNPQTAVKLNVDDPLDGIDS